MHIYLYNIQGPKNNRITTTTTVTDIAHFHHETMRPKSTAVHQEK